MSSIYGAKNAVKDGIRAYLYKDENGDYVMSEVNRLPFYLEGSPGIGKTEMVSEIAEELGIGFVSFSITHHSRNTVLGLPVISETDGCKYTEYTMSEIIARVVSEYESGVKEGILLLDEFNCMSETLMPVMLAFLQTKNIGMHRLPEGWIIVLCGNPVRFNKSARTFDVTILDRVRKIDVEFDADSFISYAEERGFDHIVLNYLKLHKDTAFICEPGKEPRVVTPRAWENLSIALKLYGKTGGAVDESVIKQFIKSGETAREFCRFYELEKKNNMSRDDMENIMNGKNIDGYCGKLEGMSFDMRFDVVDNLMKLILSCVSEKGTKPAAICRYIDNVLSLFIKFGDESLLEKAFSYINGNSRLLAILAKHKSGMFLKLCSMVYYGTVVIAADA
ncbi:MAG: ATP-binding protein [Lachnospiraceae bacterium]|nr:ATP-binding protein [Lachnospiraceae bacterium]